VGRAVRLAREDDVPHFDEADLHLLTTSSLARISELHGSPVDARRARANLLVDNGTDAGFDEDDWVGRTVRIGDVELRILRPMERCVMVTMPQLGLPEERGLLARIGEANETNLGLVAEVVAPGRMLCGRPGGPRAALSRRMGLQVHRGRGGFTTVCRSNCGISDSHTSPPRRTRASHDVLIVGSAGSPAYRGEPAARSPQRARGPPPHHPQRRRPAPLTPGAKP
jgi:hypothetical protein